MNNITQDADNVNSLVEIKNDKAVVSSLQVAEKFEKEHKDVLKAIRRILENSKYEVDEESAILRPRSNDVASRHFFKGYYKTTQGKRVQCYYMDRDGFAFLVMGFTGRKADSWKWKYIEAFNNMEDYILTRQQSKLARRSLTDAIRDILPDSPHKRFMYKNYTDLIYKTLFGKNTRQLKQELNLPDDANLREHLSSDKLRIVEKRERIVENLLDSGYSYDQIKFVLTNLSGYDKLKLHNAQTIE